MSVAATLEPEILNQWVGRSQTSHDRLDARQARLMQTLLDREATLQVGDPLPSLWHFLYFNPELPASRLKNDGHEKMGGFFPPIALPRRMWAGGEVTFLRPLVLGQRAERTTTIRSIEMKEGRSGALCFLTLEHAVSMEGEVCLTERQDLVYRGQADGSAPQRPGDRPAHAAQWSHSFTPDMVMLMRYSALTFNGHRIHFDADYARDLEHYPGPVVHGPLQATLIANWAEAHFPEKRLKQFSFRATAPVFADDTITIAGAEIGGAVQGWSANGAGVLSMKAALTFQTG